MGTTEAMSFDCNWTSKHSWIGTKLCSSYDAPNPFWNLQKSPTLSTDRVSVS